MEATTKMDPLRPIAMERLPGMGPGPGPAQQSAMEGLPATAIGAFRLVSRAQSSCAKPWRATKSALVFGSALRKGPPGNRVCVPTLEPGRAGRGAPGVLVQATT